MSGESAQLNWHSNDPSRVMPDVLSRFKSYHELDDESSVLVTPQPTQSREAAPYFGSSSSEEAEDFSTSPITSFLPIEGGQPIGRSTPSYLSVISNQPSPVASPTFYPGDGTQTNVSGELLLNEDIPNPSGPCSSLSFLPSDINTAGDVTSCARVDDDLSNDTDSTGSSDICTNYSNYYTDYLNASGFSRLSAAVRVETHVAPVESVEPSPHEETELEKSPTEFVILAEKYILMGALDPSTIFAVRKDTREYFHVKSVPVRSAHEVVSQHALLQDYYGVRSPVEVITSDDGQKSWLVFPPHYGDLHSYVRRRRRLRETEAQRLLNQIVTIVDKCHEAGLVLRDLKLRKFVFTDCSRQEIMLESLEDSVYTGDNDILNDKHGCPAYVAPEILTVAAFSGRLADMWGLGVILYTMLVGRYPFHNADTAALFAKIRNGKYSIPEWVSTRARHLILSLLRRQPNRRLSTKQVLSHPWIVRPPREHWTRDSADHAVPGELAKVVITSNKV